MNNKILSEKEVCEAVIAYFNTNRFKAFNIDKECDIHFGAGKGGNNGIADVVLRSKDQYWIAIVECKSESVGDTKKGRDQLKSYLSATDTRFGILAFNDNPNDWIYCENLRSNVFRKIKKSVFETQVSEPPPPDRKLQAAVDGLKRERKHTYTTLSAWIYQYSVLLKRERKRAYTYLITVLIIFTLAIIAGIATYFLILLPKYTDTHYQVNRIIDGDTVEILYDGTLTSVQLVGIDAPETVHSSKPRERFGREASDYLNELLLDDSIYLRFDENKWDKYDRLLGYVYRVSDGIFVNLEMIREGYARVETRFPFRYEKLFTDYESRAKSERIGLWSSSYR